MWSQQPFAVDSVVLVFQMRNLANEVRSSARGHLARGRAGISTQVCLSSNAVLFPWHHTPAHELWPGPRSVRADGPRGRVGLGPALPSPPLFASALSSASSQSAFFQAQEPCPLTKANLQRSHATCFSPSPTPHTLPWGRRGRNGGTAKPSPGTTGCPFPLTCPQPPFLSSFPSSIQQHRKLC